MSAPTLRESRRRRSGFTLLEVVIALAILGVAMYVLVSTQATAVIQTVESRKMLTGSYLAQQMMTEALLRLEQEGFTTADVEEEGDFSNWTEDMGLPDDVEVGDSFDGYQWAYAIRKIDVQLGDVAGAEDQLSAAGLGPSDDQQSAASGTEQGRDLGDMGVQPDMISEMLGPYIREVRVVVWWGDVEPDPDKACEDCIELVTHVANPSGTEVLAAGGTEEEQQ